MDLPRFFKDLQVKPSIIGNMVITDEAGMIVLGLRDASHLFIFALD